MDIVLEYQFINGEKVEILVDEVYTVIILADRACEKRK